jgi:hypothetical protein
MHHSASILAVRLGAGDKFRTRPRAASPPSSLATPRRAPSQAPLPRTQLRSYDEDRTLIRLPQGPLPLICHAKHIKRLPVRMRTASPEYASPRPHRGDRRCDQERNIKVPWNSPCATAGAIGHGHSLKTIGSYNFDPRGQRYKSKARPQAIHRGVLLLPCRRQAVMIALIGPGFKIKGGLMAAHDSGGGPGAAAPNFSEVPGSAAGAKEDRQRRKAKFGRIVTSQWFVGIVSGLISGALVTFAITATGHSTGVRMLQMAHLAPAPSCTDPGWLLQVPDDQILANSWYAQLDTVQHYGILHTADQTVDGNVRTAWLQWWPTAGLSKIPGSGNYISWSFAQPYDVRLACILLALPANRGSIYTGYTERPEPA